jgi:hypothetical protein
MSMELGAKHSKGGNKCDSLFQSLEMQTKHSRDDHKCDSFLQSLEIGLKHFRDGHKHNTLFRRLEMGVKHSEMATIVTVFVAKIWGPNILVVATNRIAYF